MGNGSVDWTPKEAEIVVGVLRDRQAKAARVRAEKVEEHLHALQAEWDRTGGFDHDHMARFLEKLPAEDKESAVTQPLKQSTG